MFGDLDWYRDLEWLRRLDEDLSSIVDCVAQDRMAEAQGGIVSLQAWFEVSTAARSSGPGLADCLKATLADWHDSRPRAITTLIKVKRHARAQLRRLHEEQFAAWPPAPHTLQTLDGRFWAPVSVDPRLRSFFALENPTGQPMSAQLHRVLTAEKVTRLFENAGESEAWDVLEMSPAHAPDLWAISKSGGANEWPAMVMQCDSMMQMLNYIDWAKELGGVIPDDHPSQEDIKGDLDGETLRDLLEHL